MSDESHENPGTPGTKLKVLRNNLKMLCHPICNWLYFLEWLEKKKICRVALAQETLDPVAGTQETLRQVA